MKVGIPKEIKNNENRVGMTPLGFKPKTFSARPQDACKARTGNKR